MPKRDDGNEQDLRVRQGVDAPSLAGDNPFTGAGADGCDYLHGDQVDHGIDVDSDGQPIVHTPSFDGPLGYPWLSTDGLCPRGFDLAILNRLFMRLLKYHFSNPACIFYPAVRQFVYAPDPVVSRISIEMNTTFQLRDDRKPSLVVFRGPQKPRRMVIGDRGERANVAGGEERYTRLIDGSHRILCVGTADGFVEDLAQEVFDFLNAASPLLRRDWPLHDFQTVGISQAGVFKDIGDEFGVAIDTAYTYEYSWTIVRDRPVINGAGIDFVTQLP